MSNEIIMNQYLEFLEEIKSEVKRAKLNVAKIVNSEKIKLYFFIGQQIVEKQEKYSWGDSVVEKLSLDLKREFGETIGFSTRNLWDMRKFYLQYKDDTIMRQLVAEIPWGQNLLIMSKIKDEEEKKFYLEAVKNYGWSRNELNIQIKADTFRRQLSLDKTNNFKETLPSHLAKQADEIMKSDYMLDFLGLQGTYLEKDLEKKMVEKIKDLILELGYGFAFLGNQYKVSTPSKDYYIDLLFYHRRLKCLVAIELKTGSFLAEYAGKMNLYLNLLDDFVKEEGENNSIGIILCADKDKFEVEYALRGLEKPMGVAEYKLTKELPKELQGALPSFKDLEEEIAREIEENQGS